MKLTCVTAVFNAIKSGNRDRLIRCVESVSALKTEHEHLIYDGASIDGTVKLLRELESTTPELKVISEPDTGIYNALNKGVRDAKGEWFYVLGCDDFLHTPCVLDSILNVDAGSGVICAPVRVDGTLDPRSMESLKGLFDGPIFCHQGELMRTSILRELDGFDERYRIVADTDLFFRAHLAGVRFRYVFDDFASFSMGGFADSQSVLLPKENSMVVANNLGLSEAERMHLEKSRLLPLRCVLRCLIHRDKAIRMSARRMVLRLYKYYRGLI